MIRPLNLDTDIEAVNRLSQWAWWPSRSRAGWDWLQAGLPDASCPLGWVWESDGEVIGLLAAQTKTYWKADRKITGISGHKLLIDPKFAGRSRSLVRHGLKLEGPEIYFSLNVNDLAARLYTLMKFETPAQVDPNLRLVWPVRPVTLAVESLQRRIRAANAYSDIKGGPEHFLNRHLCKPAVLRCEGPVSQMDLLQIHDGRIDRFWSALNTGQRPLADRSPAGLAWQLGDPALTLSPILLAYERDGELVGLLIAMMAKGSEIEAPTLEIIDLVALPDFEFSAIPALASTLIRNAAGLGAARVRLSVVNHRLASLLDGLGALKRPLPYAHSHIKYASAESRDLFANWLPTPFDGDLSFSQRPVPVASGQ